MRYYLFLLSFFLNIASLFILERPGFGWMATAIWFLSLTLLILCVYKKENTPTYFSKNEYLTLGGILIIFFGLRLINLSSIPYFINGDETWIGTEARKILNGETPHLFSFGWYSYPQLTFFLAAIPMRFFNNLFGLRLHSVILAAISVIFAYKLTKLISNKQSALFTSLILTFFHYHLHFSRSGTQYMQGLTFCLISLFFFISGVKNKNYISFVFSGIFTALGFEVYLSARITIFLICFFCLLLLLSSNTRSYFPSLKKIASFFLAFLLTISPMILMWSKSSAAFLTRKDVLIFEQKQRLQEEHGVSDWGGILIGQTKKIINFFIIGGDRSSQYGNISPAIDKITLLLLVLGIFYILFKYIFYHFSTKFRSDRDLNFNIAAMVFMVFWLLLTLLVGGILTSDAPFSPRLLMITVPIAIISGFFLDYLSKKNILFSIIIIPLLLFGILTLNVKNYFFDFQKQDIDFNSYRYTVLAYNLLPYSQKYQFSLISDSSLFPGPTIQLLVYNAQGETYQKLNSEMLNSFGKNNTIYIFTADRISDYFLLKKYYPQAEEKLIFGKKNDRLFTLAIPP